jgi:hypothetical protein
VTNEKVWKKKYIFFKLPYWKDNLLRHNLDVMHIKKNVMDNILGMLLDIKGKTKDNLKACKGLARNGFETYTSFVHKREWENLYAPSLSHNGF